MQVQCPLSVEEQKTYKKIAGGALGWMEESNDRI